MKILNERQYRVTRASAERFARTLEAFDQETSDLGGPGDMHPLARQAMRDSLESQVRVLRAQLEEYRSEQTNPVAQLPVSSLEDLPEILIRSRISSKMTQKDLATQLHLKEQQVQRWEQTRYKGVAWERLQAVLKILDVQIEGQVRRGYVPTSHAAD